MNDRPHPTPLLKIVPAPIVCLECRRQASGRAVGWRALIGGGYEGEPLVVGVFCPECAAREFD